MNEKPKSIWKKSWTGWGWLWAWLVLVTATFFIVLVVTLLMPGGSRNLGATMGASAAISAAAIVFVGLLVFIHWVWSWRNFKRFLFGLACLATLIALAYVEEDWRGWHAWNQFKHEWEAKGEKFDMAGVTPPPVPDDQNFALTPIVFTSYGSMLTRDGKLIPYKDRDTNFVNRLEMRVTRDYSDWPTNSGGSWEKATLTDLKPWQDYYRKLAAATNLFPVAPQPQSPAADVLLALSKYDPVIEELRAASKLPYSRFPLEYDKDDPAAILLPHLAVMKSCVQILHLRATAELQAGQSEKALDDVKLMLYLNQSIRTEPFLISHLVRIAILQITLQPVYECLAEHKWSDEQLVALDSELAKLDLLADYQLSMRGEMGLQGGIIEYLRRHTEQFNNITGNDFGDPMASFPARIVGQLIPGSLFSQNRLHCARMMVEFYIPLADVNQQTISPTLTQRADAAVVADTSHWSPYNILERMLLPALGKAVKKFAYGQASVDLARTAIALERYRLAHGDYPASLDALAPQFMEKIPHDIINGQPLHYRRTSDGQFVLYSVGWNEKDDGGAVVFQKGSQPREENPQSKVDINQGDWVWRYPQK